LQLLKPCFRNLSVIIDNNIAVIDLTDDTLQSSKSQQNIIFTNS